MSLTVPRAGVAAGRAPELSRVPVAQSEAGAAIAGLGDAMLQIGTGLEVERSRRELAGARVQMMDGLNNLRLEMEQVGDPDAIDRDYPARAAELKSQIIGTLSARSQPDADAMFEEMRASHGLALGARSVDLRQSQRMAQLSRTTDSAVRAGATADPTTQAVYLGQLDDHLSELVATGTITPEEAQTRRTAAAQEMEAARAMRLLSQDPAGLITALDAGADGGFANLDPTKVEAYRARAVAQIAADEAARMAEDKRAAKERVELARDTLKDGIAVFGKGRAWTGADQADAMLADPEIAALPEAREYAHARLLHEMKPRFAALPMAEKRAMLAEAEARPIGKDYEADLVEAMRAQIAADEKAWREDRFAHAAEIGLTPAPELPDPAQASATDLRRRAIYAASLRDAGQVEDVEYFSPAERDAWKDATSTATSPAERTRLAAAFMAGFGDQAEDAAREIGADGLFTYVGGMVAAGGSETLARQIFDGARVLETRDTPMPAAPQRRSAFFREFNGLFDDGTVEGRGDEAAQRDAIIAAADALYAWKRRGDPDATDSVLNEEKYLQAVHEVMGGTGDYGSDKARGGVQKLRRRLTLMPPGLAAAEVEDALDLFKAGTPEPELLDRAWRDVSASGNVPQAGGKPLNAATIDRFGLRLIEGTAYELTVPDDAAPGGVRAIYGADGRPYLIDLKKLTEWGRRK